MTKQVVRLWESVLGQLAALSKISSTTPADLSLQRAALLRIKALVKEICTCDTPQSAWKRIINEIKVGASNGLSVVVGWLGWGLLSGLLGRRFRFRLGLSLVVVWVLSPHTTACIYPAVMLILL